MPNEEHYEEEIKKFMDKVKSVEKNEKMDLSSGEDLSIGIMNLISLEEHMFFTAEKTGKKEYYDILAEVREMRKELLKKIVKDYEGEVWCMSKHLLAASMRLFEVGTKMLGKGEKEESYKLFEKAYKLYSLFWGMNLGLVSTSDVENLPESKINLLNDKDPQKNDSVGIFDKLGKIVQKAIDCCRE